MEQKVFLGKEFLTYEIPKGEISLRRCHNLAKRGERKSISEMEYSHGWFINISQLSTSVNSNECGVLSVVIKICLKRRKLHPYKLITTYLKWPWKKMISYDINSLGEHFNKNSMLGLECWRTIFCPRFLDEILIKFISFLHREINL